MLCYKSRRVEVSDSPTLVVVIPQNISNAIIQNCGDEMVYIGGRDVSADGECMGLPLAPGEKLGALDAFEFDCVEMWATAEPGKATSVVYLITVLEQV